MGPQAAWMKCILCDCMEPGGDNIGRLMSVVCYYSQCVGSLKALKVFGR